MILFLLACGAIDPPPEVPAAPLDAAALEERRVALTRQVRALVGELEVAGRYDCCIQTPCAMCAMRVGGCKCGVGLRRGEPVCEECAMMWRAGRGAEPGVDPKDVRTFLEAEKEMTDRAHAGTAAEEPGCSCPAHEPVLASPSAAPPVKNP